MSECPGAAKRRAALSAEVLAAFSTGIHLVTSVPLPGQLNPAAVAAGVRAAATHSSVRLDVFDYGSCVTATQAFRDCLKNAVAGVLPAGRVGFYQDIGLMRHLSPASGYFSSSRNPAADGFILTAKDMGLAFLDPPNLETLRIFVLRRAQAG